MNKKDLIIAVLATFCLTATLFTILPSKSVIPYDPWADVSGPNPGTEDGTINMRDIAYLIQMFGQSGNTTKDVNVTNFSPAYKVIHYISKENITSVNTWKYFNWSQTAGWIPVSGYSRMTFYLKVENWPVANGSSFTIQQLVWKSDLNGIEASRSPWSYYADYAWVRLDPRFALLLMHGSDSGSAVEETSIMGSYVYPVVAWEQTGPMPVHLNATVSIDVYLKNE